MILSTELPKWEYLEFRHLETHYEKHGAEFLCDSTEEYERQANKFISKKNLYCKYTIENGSYMYYSPETAEVAIVYCKKKKIATYFIAIEHQNYYENYDCTIEYYDGKEIYQIKNLRQLIEQGIAKNDEIYTEPLYKLFEEELTPKGEEAYYTKAANEVVRNKYVLWRAGKNDRFDEYYLETTGEFVVVYTDNSRWYKRPIITKYCTRKLDTSKFYQKLGTTWTRFIY